MKKYFIMNRTIFIWLVFVFFLSLTVVQAAGPTSEVYVVKYAANGTIIHETTVTYQWMEANLPVYGDGVTHYYHQGAVFEGDKWDQNETRNYKDKGAVKGTGIQDLCDLAGGMSTGDDVMICSPDGYHVEFSYTNVYEPLSRQGVMVLSWYNGEDTKFGESQGMGYPPDYYTGMRLVFFSDNSTNQDKKHVFGVWDMHECIPEASQHFYELYPSTDGLSIKWVDELRIYSGGYTGEEMSPTKSMSTKISGGEEDASNGIGTDASSIPGFDIIPAIVGLLLVTYMGRKR
ncbi:MAG: argininosuccinate synthase [Methanosarcinaceae archaeon]|nr:argininosuccinate synthase [Methanosarcinaceae archaeon]